LRRGFGWGGRVGWQHWDRRHPPRRVGGHGPVVRGPVPVHGPGSSHNPTGPAKCTTLACRKLEHPPHPPIRKGHPCTPTPGAKPCP
jgi:hypothetical protein